MSSIYLKPELHESLAGYIETERLERIFTNRASVWDFRHALMATQLGLFRKPIAESVRTHFSILDERTRALIFLSMIRLDSTEELCEKEEV